MIFNKISILKTVTDSSKTKQIVMKIRNINKVLKRLVGSCFIYHTLFYTKALNSFTHLYLLLID